ncbi:MAG: YhjD/YihY/BrkB family envelope integrity protein [Bacteroidota bacterium]
MKHSVKKTQEFFANDIWHVKLEKFPRWQRWFIKIVRIILLGVKDFNDKQLILRSSALTYYTLLSIVPVIAMIFGIAQGFGLENYISEQLAKAFDGQPEVRDNLMNYSHNMLQNTSGGWVAGFGFMLLIWAVVQVLGNIEDAFNSIWYVHRARSWSRKFTDYLSIMVVAPVLIILTGSVNIFISTEIQNLAETLSVLGNTVKQLIIISIKFVPFLSTWILFFLVYMVMPNTRVKIKAAITAGIIAGTAFQLFQWGYIEFQVGVSRSNAIYGSFASIPMFITWLYFSWTIVLIGAEISYSIQNVKHFEGQKKTLHISHEQRMLYVLHIIHLIVKRFKNGDNAPSLGEISQKLDIPASMCRTVADHSIRAGLIVESIDPATKEGVFTPAIDISKLTIGFVISKIEGLGELKRSSHTSEEYLRIKTLYNEMEDAMYKSPSNKHIADI